MEIRYRIKQNRSKATVDNRQSLKLKSRNGKNNHFGSYGEALGGGPSGARMDFKDIQKYSKKLMHFRDGSRTSFLTVLGANWS